MFKRYLRLYLTSDDLERIAREEEEAKAREAERCRIEAEEAQAKEAERLRLEQAARERVAELEKLHRDYESFCIERKSRNREYDHMCAEAARTLEWNKYLACALQPDGTNEPELVSYMDTWKTRMTMSSDGESPGSVSQAIAECSLAQGVVYHLEHLAADAFGREDVAKAESYLGFMHEFQVLMQRQIDCVSRYMTHFADEVLVQQQHDELVSEDSLKPLSSTTAPPPQPQSSSSSTELKQVGYNAEPFQMGMGIWMNFITRGFRNKRIDFSPLPIQIDLPKQVASQHLALRVMSTPYNPLTCLSFNSATAGPDPMMDKDFVLGDHVFTVDLLQLPPNVRKIKGWTIRYNATPTPEPRPSSQQQLQQRSELVERLSYPLEGMSSSMLPIKIQFQLSSDCIYDEDNLRVGWWDTKTQSWSEEGIHEVKFHMNVLNFHTTQLSAFGILQERNYYFQNYVSWSIHTTWVDDGHTPEAVVCLVNHANLEIRFRVQAGKCQLAAAAGLDTSTNNCVVSKHPMMLEALTQSWHSRPGELLEKLRRKGLYLTPTRDGDDVVFDHAAVAKHPELERRLVQDVARVASAYDVSNVDPQTCPQKWLVENLNSGSGNAEAAVIRVKRQGASNKVHHVLVEMDEEVTAGVVKYRLDTQEDQIYASEIDLRHALEEITTVSAHDQMALASVAFEKTLGQLLSRLRIFSYCKASNCRTMEPPVRTSSPVQEEISPEETGIGEVITSSEKSVSEDQTSEEQISKAEQVVV